MAHEKLTDRTALTTPAGADLVHVVDVSDTTVDAAGNSKKMTITNLMTLAPVQTADLADFATEAYVDTAVGNEQSARITADTALQSQITANDTDIAANAAGIAANAGGVATNATDISNLDGRVTAAETNIATNTTDIGDLDTRLTTAEGNITSNDTDISSLNGRVTTNESDIAGLQTDLGALNLTDLNDTPVGYGTAGQVLATNATANGTEWVTVSGGGGAVDSVNGQTGVVVLDTDDIAEGSNLYYTDTRVSTYLASQNISASYPTSTLTGNTLLAATHEQKMLLCNSAAGFTIQIPSGLERDAEVLVYQEGAGSITITAGSGVTLRNTSGFQNITAEQYAIIGLKQLGTTDVWVVTGERKPV